MMLRILTLEGDLPESIVFIAHTPGCEKADSDDRCYYESTQIVRYRRSVCHNHRPVQSHSRRHPRNCASMGRLRTSSLRWGSGNARSKTCANADWGRQFHMAGTNTGTVSVQCSYRHQIRSANCLLGLQLRRYFGYWPRTLRNRSL
jgi:hypothetical protein